MSEDSFIIYRTDDGTTEIQLKSLNGSVWLTQAEIAELFMTSKQNISLHLKNIFESNELQEISVVKETLTTAADGKSYHTKIYNLDAILAIGYRVSSPRGTQFRIWATTILREYLIKGFVMNDERLKNPGSFDYFDELLERIRDIRASEKLFYQKVKDIYTQSVDYDAKSEQAKDFFKTVQNKMLYATTGCTAAELVVKRSDANIGNMGLTHWEGSKQGKGVRKKDVITAKNYLTEQEISELNRIVTMFLDTAEDTAKRRQSMYMKDWEARLDDFLRFNERPVLSHSGKITHAQAEKLADERYDVFHLKREAENNELAQREAAEEFKQLQTSITKK